MLASPRVSNLPGVIFGADAPELLRPCDFYVYGVANRPELSKPGISNDHARRAGRAASRGLYGEMAAAWDMPTRRDALLIEGAILRDRSIATPDDLGPLAALDGASEVRRIAPDALVTHAERLIESLADHDGPWQQWALDHVPTLHRAERVALRRQLAAAA
jgi:hypothetical protein